MGFARCGGSSAHVRVLATRDFGQVETRPER